jgi:hypothetical protein
MERVEVPVANDVVNLSPMPRSAPPPLGTETDGTDGSGEVLAVETLELLPVVEVVAAVEVWLVWRVVGAVGGWERVEPEDAALFPR